MNQNPIISIEPETPDVSIEIKVSNEGEPGYTPQRGLDYWTDADKKEIVDDVKQEIGELPGGGTVKSVNGKKPDENGNVHIEPELPDPEDIPVIGASGSEGEYGKFLTVTSRNQKLEWGLDGDVVRFSSDIYSAERPNVLKMGYTRNNDALAYTTRDKKILTLPRTINIDGKVYEPTDDGEIVLPSAYTFPTASKTTKGGVVIGDGIEVEDGGRISVPLASNDGPAGLVAPGKGLEIRGNLLKVRYDEFVATGEEQALPDQKKNQARSNIGAASAEDVARLTEEKADKKDIPAPYILPTASADIKGGVKIGKGLQMDGEKVRVVPEGEWELIETHTITETTSEIERTEYPDGTPYNLSAIKVIVKVAPGTTAQYWFPTGFDKSGRAIVGAVGKIPGFPSNVAESHRSSLVFNATPLYGFYDCWASGGSQGGDMSISRASNAQYQTQTTEAKIAKFKFGLYLGDLAEKSSFEIWGVRA